MAADFETTIGINGALFRTDLQRITDEAERHADTVNARMANRTRIFAQRQAADLRRQEAERRGSGRSGDGFLGEVAKSFVTIELVKQGFRAAGQAADFARERNSMLRRENERLDLSMQNLVQNFGRDWAVAMNHGVEAAIPFLDTLDAIRRRMTNSLSDVFSGTPGNAAGVDAALMRAEQQDRLDAWLRELRDTKRGRDVDVAALGDDDIAAEQAQIRAQLDATTEKYRELRRARVESLGPRLVDATSGREGYAWGQTVVGQAGLGATLLGPTGWLGDSRKVEREGYRAERTEVDRLTAEQEAAETEAMRERLEQLSVERVKREAARFRERRQAGFRADATGAAARGDREAEMEARRRLAMSEAAERQIEENERLGVTGAEAAQRVADAQLAVSREYHDQIDALRERERLERESAERREAAESAAAARARESHRATVDRLRVETLLAEGHDASARALQLVIERRERLAAIARDETLSAAEKKRLTEQTIDLLDRRSQATRESGDGPGGIRGIAGSQLAELVVGHEGVARPTALEMRIARRRRFAEDREVAEAIGSGRAVSIRQAPERAPGMAGGAGSRSEASLDRAVGLLQEILSQSQEQTRVFDGLPLTT